MKYEVTFAVYDSSRHDALPRTWTAVYEADNYGDAERHALRTLEENNDKESQIDKIERW